MARLSGRLDRLERAANFATWQAVAARAAADHHLPLAALRAEVLRIAADHIRHPWPRRADGSLDARRGLRAEARRLAAERGLDSAELLRDAEQIAADLDTRERERQTRRRGGRR